MRLASHDGAAVYRVAHMCCGIGAGAAGFNDAQPRVGSMKARFECAGGIDVDERGLRNFEKLTGAKGTLLDLFDREQYVAFHGKQPPAGWREATPADVRRAYGDRHVDVLFASMPCKGFSGLLSAAAAGTEKYQALNRLTLRGLWLFLEAFKDDPARILLFENVPRIATRGRDLLDRIKALVMAYGFIWTETEHDCGVIGGLGQSRRRFLGIGRHPGSVPNFVYEPEKHRLRGVGEIIGKLPLPGDAVAGFMHRVPMLQWKTWVRLALVPAGRDWRALNELAVVDGVLRDFGILPDEPLRDNALGVNGWGDTAPLITGARAPGQGRFSVADPRAPSDWNNESLGVREWDAPARVVAGASRPHNGAHSVADPRPTQANQGYQQYGVKPWDDASIAVSGQSSPGGGPYSVADPRVENGHPRSVQLGVGRWDQPAAVVKGDVSVGTGRYAVPDPRIERPRFNNLFRIVPMDGTSPSIPGPGGTGLSVADPRPAESSYSSRKYKVTPYEDASRAVIGASTTGDGAFAVADPRPTHGPNAHANKMRVVDASHPAPIVTGSDRVGSGALSVADPRPVGLSSEQRGATYASQGHYGVAGWEDTSLAVPGFAKYDRGRWSVADPRAGGEPEPRETLPAADERLVARILSTDNTWHRPFTTLELAALQSIVIPEEAFAVSDEGAWTRLYDFDLIDGSDATKREWIGNAVPRKAARGMAETIGETLLLADMGETFTLSSRAIWVSPVAVALAVDPRQDVYGEAI